MEQIIARPEELRNDDKQQTAALMVAISAYHFSNITNEETQRTGRDLFVGADAVGRNAEAVTRQTPRRRRQWMIRSGWPDAATSWTPFMVTMKVYYSANLWA